MRKKMMILAEKWAIKKTDTGEAIDIMLTRSRNATAESINKSMPLAVIFEAWLVMLFPPGIGIKLGEKVSHQFVLQHTKTRF